MQQWEYSGWAVTPANQEFISALSVDRLVNWHIEYEGCKVKLFSFIRIIVIASIIAWRLTVLWTVLQFLSSWTYIPYMESSEWLNWPHHYRLILHMYSHNTMFCDTANFALYTQLYGYFHSCFLYMLLLLHACVPGISSEVTAVSNVTGVGLWWHKDRLSLHYYICLHFVCVSRKLITKFLVILNFNVVMCVGLVLWWLLACIPFCILHFALCIIHTGPNGTYYSAWLKFTMFNSSVVVSVIIIHQTVTSIQYASHLHPQESQLLAKCQTSS